MVGSSTGPVCLVIDKRIRDLRARLAIVQKRKEREVKARSAELSVSLVGYTNAGKSTLMNRLTGAGVLAEEQAAEFSLLGKLNQISGVDYPDDPKLRARIKSYELAFGMQAAVPETLELADPGRRVPGIVDSSRSLGCTGVHRRVLAMHAS